MSTTQQGKSGLRALQLGCDVVLDWGVWSREKRDLYRTGARDVGARVVFSEIGDQVVKRLGYHLTTIPREWSAQWLSLLGRLINSSKIAT